MSTIDRSLPARRAGKIKRGWRSHVSAFDRALMFDERGHRENAISWYRRAFLEYPDDPNIHVNLGRLYHERGEYREAGKHYAAAIRLNPLDVVAHFNMGHLHECEWLHKKAHRSYLLALRCDPDFADAHYNLVFVCMKIEVLDFHSMRYHERCYEKITGIKMRNPISEE